MHDRAWPFQRPGVSVRECEETQGWDKRCLDVWKSQEVLTAALLVVACVGNWAFTVRLATTSDNAMLRFQKLLTSRTVRLRQAEIEFASAGRLASAATRQDPEQQQTYTDSSTSAFVQDGGEAPSEAPENSIPEIGSQH